MLRLMGDFFLWANLISMLTISRRQIATENDLAEVEMETDPMIQSQSNKDESLIGNDDSLNFSHITSVK